MSGVFDEKLTKTVTAALNPAPAEEKPAAEKKEAKPAPKKEKTPEKADKSATKRVRWLKQRDWPIATEGGKKNRKRPNNCTSPRIRCYICGTANSATASSSLCDVCSSWTMPNN